MQENDVEPSIQFLINNEVPIHDVKCFDQLSYLKKIHGKLPQ